MAKLSKKSQNLLAFNNLETLRSVLLKQNSTIAKAHSDLNKKNFQLEETISTLQTEILAVQAENATLTRRLIKSERYALELETRLQKSITNAQQCQNTDTKNASIINGGNTTHQGSNSFAQKRTEPWTTGDGIKDNRPKQKYQMLHSLSEPKFGEITQLSKSPDTSLSHNAFKTFEKEGLINETMDLSPSIDPTKEDAYNTYSGSTSTKFRESSKPRKSSRRQSGLLHLDELKTDEPHVEQSPVPNRHTKDAVSGNIGSNSEIIPRTESNDMQDRNVELEYHDINNSIDDEEELGNDTQENNSHGSISGGESSGGDLSGYSEDGSTIERDDENDYNDHISYEDEMDITRSSFEASRESQPCIPEEDESEYAHEAFPKRKQDYLERREETRSLGRDGYQEDTTQMAKYKDGTKPRSLEKDEAYSKSNNHVESNQTISFIDSPMNKEYDTPPVCKPNRTLSLKSNSSAAVMLGNPDTIWEAFDTDSSVWVLNDDSHKIDSPSLKSDMASIHKNGLQGSKKAKAPKKSLFDISGNFDDEDGEFENGLELKVPETKNDDKEEGDDGFGGNDTLIDGELEESRVTTTKQEVHSSTENYGCQNHYVVIIDEDTNEKRDQPKSKKRKSSRRVEDNKNKVIKKEDVTSVTNVNLNDVSTTKKPATTDGAKTVGKMSVEARPRRSCSKNVDYKLPSLRTKLRKDVNSIFDAVVTEEAKHEMKKRKINELDEDKDIGITDTRKFGTQLEKDGSNIKKNEGKVSKEVSKKKKKKGNAHKRHEKENVI